MASLDHQIGSGLVGYYFVILDRNWFFSHGYYVSVRIGIGWVGVELLRWHLSENIGPMDFILFSHCCLLRLSAFSQLVCCRVSWRACGSAQMETGR